MQTGIWVYMGLYGLYATPVSMHGRCPEYGSRPCRLDLNRPTFMGCIRASGASLGAGPHISALLTILVSALLPEPRALPYGHKVGVRVVGGQVHKVRQAHQGLGRVPRGGRGGGGDVRSKALTLAGKKRKEKVVVKFDNHNHNNSSQTAYLAYL